jgi:hypothetical protein
MKGRKGIGRLNALPKQCDCRAIRRLGDEHRIGPLLGSFAAMTGRLARVLTG